MTAQDVWDELDTRLQDKWRGNLDPWAGPVDPVAEQRWLARHRRDVESWQAKREQEPCGCWSLDCAECGARAADGQRPVPGGRVARALRVEAVLNRCRA